MSMFRSAADISSSDSESDDDQSKDHLQSPISNNELSHGSRRASIDGTTAKASEKPNSSSGLDSSISLDDISVPQDALEANVERHGNMMTAALLEFYCTTRAADILNAQPGSTRKFTRQSPEAQYLGKKLYQYKSQFLSSHGVLADGVDKEELGATRQSYRDNLDLLGRAALEDLNLNEPQPRTPIEGGQEFALVSRNQHKIRASENRFRQDERRQLPSVGKMDVLEGIPTGAQSLPHPSRSLFGSSPVSMPLFNTPAAQSYNHMSRYSVEFQELKVLGRGSFGEVYHVKNHIDGQEYAVKKIPLSQRRLDQLQYGGQNQLESIMKEIRTLARLEHANVVRYYGAWVEQAHVDLSNYHRKDFQKDFQRDSNMPFEHRLHTTREHSEINLSSQGSTNEPSMGIVFEHSESSVTESHPSSVRSEHGFSTRISRWDSHATTTSRHSKKSSVVGVEEEEIESIPRHFDTHGQTSTFGETDDIFTDGLSQDQSRLQVQRRPRASQQPPPAVILHIQMSLHPISLNTYLNPQATGGDSTPSPARRHCFHLMPTLKLMLDIVSGVEYLHSKDIVHRDLKPANIFLSAPEKTENHTCSRCTPGPNSPNQFCRPRIGDFGLVADISHLNEATPEGSITPYHAGPKIQRVVGTEFYRPPANDTSGYFEEYKIDEKLDVYALGVILFELVYRLSTKMERQFVLNDLTRGSIKFPDDFTTKIDHGETRLDTGDTVADSLRTCIQGMLAPQSPQRWSCQQVKEHLRRIQKAVKRLLAAHQT